MAQVNVISHRGANVYAPQNTIPAFLRSLKIGVDGFETDVHITKDNKIVICHNYTIDKTSDGKGSISQMTLEELRQYDFGSYFSPRYEGTKIPTLDDFLEAVGGADLKVLNIELKSPKENETAIVRETIRIVKEHGLFDRLLLSSFDPKLVIEAKQIDKNCKTGFLYSPNRRITYTMFRRPVEYAKTIGADALHPAFIYVDEEYVKKAHDAGIMVNPWTVDGVRSIERMIRCGVDGIISNYPDVVRGLCEKHGVETK